MLFTTLQRKFSEWKAFDEAENDFNENEVKQNGQWQQQDEISGVAHLKEVDSSHNNALLMPELRVTDLGLG